MGQLVSDNVCADTGRFGLIPQIAQVGKIKYNVPPMHSSAQNLQDAARGDGAIAKVKFGCLGFPPSAELSQLGECGDELRGDGDAIQGVKVPIECVPVSLSLDRAQ